MSSTFCSLLLGVLICLLSLQGGPVGTYEVGRIWGFNIPFSLQFVEQFFKLWQFSVRHCSVILSKWLVIDQLYNVYSVQRNNMNKQQEQNVTKKEEEEKELEKNIQ